MTKTWILACALLVGGIIGGSSPALSQTEAPFGVKWGASAEEIRSLGVDLKEVASKTFGTGYQASSLPKILNDQESTLLSFGFSNKLWRMIAVSKSAANDPYGAAIKSRYEELRGILSEKYGNPKSVHNLGGSIYSQPKYFLAGLRGGKSSWFSDFKAGDIELQLGLGATDSSTGHWRMIYEFVPLRGPFEIDRKRAEKGAL